MVFARRLLTPRTDVDLADDLSGDERASAKVFMAAPNTASPAYSLDRYLADVCQEAKEHRDSFSTGGT